MVCKLNQCHGGPKFPHLVSLTYGIRHKIHTCPKATKGSAYGVVSHDTRDEEAPWIFKLRQKLLWDDCIMFLCERHHSILLKLSLVGEYVFKTLCIGGHPRDNI